MTPETLAQARLLRDTRNPVVILGRGEVNLALKVRVHRVSQSARSKIEAAGGHVELIEAGMSCDRLINRRVDGLQTLLSKEPLT